MRYTVIFQCGFIENCPTCEQEDPATACRGSKRLTLEVSEPFETIGALMEAVGDFPRCPRCGEYMVMTDRFSH